MTEWIQPGALIAVAGLVLALVSKVFLNIEAIKKGAVSGANLDNSLKGLSSEVEVLKKDIARIQAILTNGLSTQMLVTKNKVESMESTHRDLMQVWQTTMKELTEIKTRCEERSKWVTERQPGRREYDSETCR